MGQWNLVVGYYRSKWGESVSHGYIGTRGMDPPSLRRHYVTWYRCGVDIPGLTPIVTLEPDSSKLHSIPHN